MLSPLSLTPIMRPRDPRFNTPAEMWVRFVYASQLVLFIVGVCYTASAFHESSWLDALVATSLFLAMFTAHIWLRRTGKLAGCNRALDEMFSNGSVDGSSDELDALLQRRASIEKTRGTPSFDPWEIQSVRRDINAYLRLHPEAADYVDAT